MAMSLNKVQLIGNLTRDPEIKTTTGNSLLATFSLATNHTWIDKDGQKQEKPEYHSINVWGKLAEICQQYVSKGQKLYIEGRIQTKEWEAENGEKKFRTEIIAEKLIILSSPKYNHSEPETNNSTDLSDNDDSLDINDLPF